MFLYLSLQENICIFVFKITLKTKTSHNLIQFIFINSFKSFKDKTFLSVLNESSSLELPNCFSFQIKYNQTVNIMVFRVLLTGSNNSQVWLSENEKNVLGDVSRLHVK